MKQSAQRNAIVYVCNQKNVLGVHIPRNPRFFLEDGTPLNFLGLSKPDSSCEPAPFNLTAAGFKVGQQKGKIKREDLDCLFGVNSAYGTTPASQKSVGVVLFSDLPAEPEKELARTQIEALHLLTPNVVSQKSIRIPKTATPFFFKKSGRVATYVPLITD